MFAGEWWNLYGMETPTLRLLAVRILSQTVSSSPCERNWSTFSLIYTQRRNRMGYEKLKKLVFCYYNMRLRERLLWDENREAEDPLDLMMIGQHAHLEEDDTREDPLYEWLRSDDLDRRDGAPAEAIAEEARQQGVDVEEVLQREHTPEDIFDPLSRAQTQSFGQGGTSSQRLFRSSSSSRTQTRDDDDDDDDDGGDGGGGGGSFGGGGDDDDDGTGGGGGGGGGTSYPQSQRACSQFTCEERYTHATQDEDHGARSPVRQYERRSAGRKGKAPVESDALTDTMASVDLGGSGQGSSYDHRDILSYPGLEENKCKPWDLTSQAAESSYGYGDVLSYPGFEENRSKPWDLIPQAAESWSSSSHGWYQPSSQPYGYSSSDCLDSGADSSTSHNIFGGPYPYGYISYEPPFQSYQEDDELEEPARHSTWY